MVDSGWFFEMKLANRKFLVLTSRVVSWGENLDARKYGVCFYMLSCEDSIACESDQFLPTFQIAQVSQLGNQKGSRSCQIDSSACGWRCCQVDMNSWRAYSEIWSL